MPSEAKIISVLTQTLLRPQLTIGRVDLTQVEGQPPQVESSGILSLSRNNLLTKL
jgi:hypothetical protein